MCCKLSLTRISEGGKQRLDGVDLSKCIHYLLVPVDWIHKCPASLLSLFIYFTTLSFTFISNKNNILIRKWRNFRFLKSLI